MAYRNPAEELPHYIAEILRQTRNSFNNDEEVIAKVKRDGITYEEFAALAITHTLLDEYSIAAIADTN